MVNIEETKYTAFNVFDFNCDNAASAASATPSSTPSSSSLSLSSSTSSSQSDGDDASNQCSKCNLSSTSDSTINPDETYLCVHCCNMYNRIIRVVNVDNHLLLEKDKYRNPWPILDAAFLIHLFDIPYFYRQLYETIIRMQSLYGDTYSIEFNDHRLFVDKNQFVFK